MQLININNQNLWHDLQRLSQLIQEQQIQTCQLLDQQYTQRRQLVEQQHVNPLIYHWIVGQNVNLAIFYHVDYIQQEEPSLFIIVSSLLVDLNSEV